MSFQASVSKLGPSIKELVSSFSNQYAAAAAGSNEKDESEVVSWIEKVSQGDVVKSEKLNDLNAVLVPKTYIAASYLTAADVALYAALHPVISKLQAPEYHSYPSVTRYFDHIQSIPPVRSIANASSFSVVNLDLTNAPKIERAADAPKKKEKKDATTEPTSSTPAISAPPAANEGKSQKKEKKEKKDKPATADTAKENKKEGKKAASGKSTPAPDEGEPVPSMIDLRVGHILDVQKHPDADGLYIEQIDIGEETGPRTVVSGLVHYIPIEQMRDKYLVAVCNLKPANMRGVKSFAMVLCATSKEGKEGGIELIQPPANSKPGDRVYFEGDEFENATPVSQLNPKKKIFETVQPGFITLESREAAWVDPTTKSVHKIRTKEGVCVAPTLVGASLS